MILCITHSQDIYTIDLVQQHLADLQMPSFRLNVDEFGLHYRFAYSLKNGQEELELVTAGSTLKASDIKGVWYRKYWDLQWPQGLEEDYRPAFKKEYGTALSIFWDALQHLPWINPIRLAQSVIDNKLGQLSAARKAGLITPPTLLSNNAAEVRTFFAACRGNMIMKLHNALSRTMSGDGAFLPTTLVRQEDLDELEALVYCPMIFQEAIVKQYELRIVYVDGEFFTGKITADSNNADNTPDWRTSSHTQTQWQPYELPAAEVRRLNQLMKLLQLPFGAIDMIRRPDGAYVFLEVNPQGEWGMLQRDLDYPIAQTIAHKLVQKINK